MNKVTTAELQEKNLEMLLYFDSFCREHNLIYYLCGGCLIGAVRHQGFIPWDDDVDVFMPRPDYERLSELWISDGDNDRYVYCRTNLNENYHDGGASIRDVNTTYINRHSLGEKIVHGLALEIMPIDGCPKGKIKRIGQLFNAFKFSLFNVQRLPDNKGGFIRAMSKLAYRLVPDKSARYRIWKRAERKMTRYDWDSCQQVTELIGSLRGMFIRHPKEDFAETLLLDFEGHKLPVMKGYQRYLGKIWGDYMQLPPKEEQVAKHDVVYVNLKASYRDFCRDYPIAYGGFNLDKRILAQSSSGGIFHMLATRVLKEGGVVYGAAFNEDFAGVSQVRIENEGELPRIMGSKYLQSNVGDSYREAALDLEKGLKVLYSGTPCQIRGLNKYLGKKYDKLLTVQVACHGVALPGIWEKYLKEINPEQLPIASMNFRDKTYGWELYSLTGKMNNKSLDKGVMKVNPYMRLYLGNYSLRESCFDCSCKELMDNADILLADFWRVRACAPFLENKRGTSLVLAYNEEAQKLIEDLSEAKLERVDTIKAITSNYAILYPSKRPKDYENYQEDIDKKSISELADIYTPISGRLKLELSLRRMKRKVLWKK